MISLAIVFVLFVGLVCPAILGILVVFGVLGGAAILGVLFVVGELLRFLCLFEHVFVLCHCLFFWPLRWRLVGERRPVGLVLPQPVLGLPGQPWQRRLAFLSPLVVL